MVLDALVQESDAFPQFRGSRQGLALRRVEARQSCGQHDETRDNHGVGLSPRDVEAIVGGECPAISVEGLRERSGATKPAYMARMCIILMRVGQPEHNRFSWIKGAATSDTLRQACIDPEHRAFVADQPPAGAFLIRKLKILIRMPLGPVWV